MENKVFEVQIPKGYEIDRESSTFEHIVFKPINSITYNDVCNKIFNGKARYYISSDAIISPCAGNRYSNNEALDSYQLERVLSINQLFNIAKYYNGDWEPDWSNPNELKYYIYYNYSDKSYIVSAYVRTIHGVPIFKYEEDAQAIIDNPNFRDILDTIFKNNEG